MYKKFKGVPRFAKYPTLSRMTQTMPNMVSRAAQTLKNGVGKGKVMYSTFQAPARAVSTAFAGSRTTTSTINNNKKSKEIKKVPKKSVQVNTVAELVKAHMRSMDMVCQKLAESDSQTGANFLRNIPSTTGERPLHVYALNTLDRDTTISSGDAFCQFILTQNADFIHPVNLTGTSDPSPVMVYGNTQHLLPLQSASKLLFNMVKIKLQFYGRINRATKYVVKIVRLRKTAVHCSPYIGCEEALDASARLTTSQLEERKAFWIDSLLRPNTVNPSVLTGYALNRVKKLYETLYSRTVEIEETLADEDQSNRTDITITLPINKMINYNWEADNRYSGQTDADRVDRAINTDVTDLADVKSGHKPAPYAGLFLIITANNTTTTTEDTTQGTGAGYVAEKLPSYDISFMARYKALALGNSIGG